MGTLLFLAVFSAVLVLLALAAVQLARGQPGRALRSLGGLVVLAAVYLVAVAAVALANPRQERTAGRPLCFDDWCVAARSARPASGPVAGCPPDARVWLVTLEVSSHARRVTQREKAAVAYLEDAAGRRHPSCGLAFSEGGREAALHDAVGPGASFTLTLPFALSENVAPAGVVIRHPHTPGVVVVGDDEALFHQPTLLRLPIP